jgi:hypothetical protein
LFKNLGLLVIYNELDFTEGFIGVFQKGELNSMPYKESDLVGNWEWIAVWVNANFVVTESSTSSAKITIPDG